jgi:hypothetical protein
VNSIFRKNEPATMFGKSIKHYRKNMIIIQQAFINFAQSVANDAKWFSKTNEVGIHFFRDDVPRKILIQHVFKMFLQLQLERFSFDASTIHQNLYLFTEICFPIDFQQLHHLIHLGLHSSQNCEKVKKITSSFVSSLCCSHRGFQKE